MKRLKLDAQKGSSLVEMSILIALVSLLCISAVRIMGKRVADNMCNASLKITLSSEFTAIYDDTQNCCAVAPVRGALGGGNAAVCIAP